MIKFNLDLWNEDKTEYDKEKYEKVKKGLIDFYNKGGFFELPENQIYVDLKDGSKKLLGYIPHCYILILVNDKKEAQIYIYATLDSLKYIIRSTTFEFETAYIFQIYNGYITHVLDYNTKDGYIEYENFIEINFKDSIISNSEKFAQFILHSNYYSYISYFSVDYQGKPEVDILPITDKLEDSDTEQPK